MRNEKQIIAELKNCMNRSKPFRLYTSAMALLDELDSKFPIEEESVVKETIEELIVEKTAVNSEQNILIKNEEGIFEEINPIEELVVEETQIDNLIVEETVVEEPTVEESVVEKKTTKKK